MSESSAIFGRDVAVNGITWPVLAISSQSWVTIATVTRNGMGFMDLLII